MADMQIAAEIIARNNTAPGLKSAAGDVRGAANEIASSLGEANTVARDTARVHELVAEKLRDHGREMKQTSRSAKILSRDIASLGLDAKGAAGEVAMLVGGFAVGNGVGLGVEVV